MHLLLGCIIICLACLGIYGGLPQVYSLYCRRVLQKQTNARRAVVLTFDDGPGERMTKKILSYLKEHNVKATFFLLGRNVQGRAGVLRQIIDDGHEICSHGYEHLDNRKISPWHSIANVRKGWRSIDLALGTRCGRYPFRPPYGRLNLCLLLYLWLKRVPVIYWTVDSGDTLLNRGPSVSQAADAVKAAGGGVILWHDFDRSDEKTETFVLDSLRLAIEAVKLSRLTVVGRESMKG